MIWHKYKITKDTLNYRCNLLGNIMCVDKINWNSLDWSSEKVSPVFLHGSFRP